MLEEARAAATRGGGVDVHAQFFEDGREIGVSFEKNGHRHALRLKLDRAASNVGAEIEGFVRSWTPRRAA